jgi:hypothetical protein
MATGKPVPVRAFRRIFGVIKVSFAAQRPEGAFALAIPIRGEDMLHDRLAGLDEPTRTLAARSAEAQRFEKRSFTREISSAGCCSSVSAPRRTRSRCTNAWAAP